VQLLDDKSEHMGSSIASQSIGGDLPHSSLRSFSPESCWFIIRVCPQRCEPFLIKRFDISDGRTGSLNLKLNFKDVNVEGLSGVKFDRAV